MFGVAVCLYLYSVVRLIVTFVSNIGSDVASKVYDDYDSDSRYAQRVKYNKGYLESIVAFIVATLIVACFL